MFLDVSNWLLFSWILTTVLPHIKYSIQLVQLVTPEIWAFVWAHFLARLARAKLSSAQLAKFKIWKSSTQLSSPNSKSEKLSSACEPKNSQLVPPLLLTYQGIIILNERRKASHSGDDAMLNSYIPWFECLVNLKGFATSICSITNHCKE